MTFAKMANLSQQTKDQMAQLQKLKSAISSNVEQRVGGRSDVVKAQSPVAVKARSPETAGATNGNEKRKALEQVANCDSKKARLAELSV